MTKSFAFENLSIFLDERLEARAYAAIRDRHGRSDQNGVFRPSQRGVEHLTLALEPWPGLQADVEAHRADAIFLHRPWKLTAAEETALQRQNMGVLAYHLSFDEHFTLGYNPHLAQVLGAVFPPEELGYKEGRRLGMLLELAAAQPREAMLAALSTIFQGLESSHAAEDGPDTIKRVAVVGAMTDALVREASQRGAQLYITGQRRQPAAAAVHETRMTVAEVGHLRSEVWGLRALADEITDRLGLKTTVIV